MNEIVRPPASDPNSGWNASPTHSVSIARESNETGQIAAALVSALSGLRNPPRNRSVEVSTRGGVSASYAANSARRAHTSARSACPVRETCSSSSNRR